MPPIMSQTQQQPTSPVIQVWNMITSNWVSQTLYVAAELRIPDLLANQPMTSEELAPLVGAHAPSVHRLLRALTTLEICHERANGTFELTELGAILCSDHEESLRSWLLYSVGYLWPIWGNLLYSVKTGKSARALLTGNQEFEHLERSPETAALFNQAMLEQTRVTAKEVVSVYDFSRMRRIVDIGGGYGQLLAAILLSNPSAQGVLFDLPHALAAGQKHMRELGLAERCEIVSGSFFEAVPPKGDGYLLKSILHDWPNEQCQKILACCRNAMTPDSKLLIIDRIYPDQIEASREHQSVARSDLNMLVGPGGQERTFGEFKELLQTAGFTVHQIIPLALSFSILEVVKMDS